MSELATSASNDNFDLPAELPWRVQRLDTRRPIVALVAAGDGRVLARVLARVLVRSEVTLASATPEAVHCESDRAAG